MRISRMNKKTTITGGIVLAAACAAAVPAAAAHAGTWVTAVHASTRAAGHTANPMGSTDGCPSGDVCMYKSQPGPGSTPEHRWFNYGCYNLHGEYGERWVFNNQTGGATATMRNGYNCTEGSTVIPSGATRDGDIGDINSISLQQ